MDDYDTLPDIVSNRPMADADDDADADADSGNNSNCGEPVDHSSPIASGDDASENELLGVTIPCVVHSTGGPIFTGT